MPFVPHATAQLRVVLLALVLGKLPSSQFSPRFVFVDTWLSGLCLRFWQLCTVIVACVVGRLILFGLCSTSRQYYQLKSEQTNFTIHLIPPTNTMSSSISQRIITPAYFKIAIQIWFLFIAFLFSLNENRRFVKCIVLVKGNHIF